MLNEKNLPNYFWVEEVATVVYIMNQTPTMTIHGMIAKKKFTCKKPNVSHLKVFSCIAYVHVPNEKRSTIRNLAFCNYLMQLVSSCMRHMQLEIRLVANDKLHEICSCMRQSYNTSIYDWVIRFHPPIFYTSSWSCDYMQLQGLRSHCITC